MFNVITQHWLYQHIIKVQYDYEFVRLYSYQLSPLFLITVNSKEVSLLTIICIKSCYQII